MSEKYPIWTRTRVGRDRVYWAAYDDRPGAEDRRVVAQGHAASLPEADASARSALADAGMHGSRRTPTGLGPPAQGARAQARNPGPPPSGRVAPRAYLYTRHHGDQDGGTFTAAHLTLRKTLKKVYVTRQSCGPDQLGTDDERWDQGKHAIALDRARLERDGSAYSVSHPTSEFYASREEAMGDSSRDGSDALAMLGIEAPCTLEDIKAAYRRKALEVHPDRGGNPDDFRAVEDAYRRLLREAQAPGTLRPFDGSGRDPIASRMGFDRGSSGRQSSSRSATTTSKLSTDAAPPNLTNQARRSAVAAIGRRSPRSSSFGRRPLDPEPAILGHPGPLRRGFSMPPGSLWSGRIAPEKGR